MIERYSHEKHYKLVEDWLAARNMQIPPKELFSEKDIGFVVDNRAVGFLIHPEGTKVAYFDRIAGDPNLRPSLRDEALRDLFDTLEIEAKNRGAALVQILGGLPAMRVRFDSRGYENFGLFTLHYKVLLEGVE